MYFLNDYDFYLPEEQIAQVPSAKREDSKLFVINRLLDNYKHTNFLHISDYIKNDDILVLNDAKVIPARMFFERETGGAVEVVLAHKIDDTNWQVVTNRTKKLKKNEVIVSIVDSTLSFTITGRMGEYLNVRSSKALTDELLDRVGKIPLPPYIRREPTEDDVKRYQTIYAQNSGAVAAPTAGLHFTDQILSELQSKGVGFAYVTLDVSWGTFSPVRSQSIEEHTMHSEYYELSATAADIINQGRIDGRRIIAVGTTALRVLESSYREGKNYAYQGETDIFIYPPQKIKSIDALLTNFHTPKSTLLMLVAAFAGYDRIMKAYEEAVSQKYRFFSYGDSMFIE